MDIKLETSSIKNENKSAKDRVARALAVTATEGLVEETAALEHDMLTNIVNETHRAHEAEANLEAKLEINKISDFFNALNAQNKRYLINKKAIENSVELERAINTVVQETNRALDAIELSITENTDKIKATNANTSTDLAKQEIKLNTLKEDLLALKTALDTSLRQLNLNITEATDKQQLTSKDILKLQKVDEKLAEELKAIVSTNKSFSHDTTRNLLDLENGLSLVETTAANTATKLATLTNIVNSYVNDTALANELVELNEKQIIHIRDTAFELWKLNKLIAELQFTLNTNKSEDETLKNRLDALHYVPRELSHIWKSLNSLSSKVSDTNDQVETNEEAITEINKQLADITPVVEDYADNKSSIFVRLDDLEGLLAETSNTYGTLIAQIIQTVTDISDMSTDRLDQFNKLSVKMTAIEQTISQLETIDLDISQETDDKLAATKQELIAQNNLVTAELRAKIAELEDTCSSLAGQDTNILAKLAYVKERETTRYNETSEKLTALEKLILNNKNLSAAETKVVSDTLTDYIRTNDAQVATVNNTLNITLPRIADLEASVVQLDNIATKTATKLNTETQERTSADKLLDTKVDLETKARQTDIIRLNNKLDDINSTVLDAIKNIHEFRGSYDNEAALMAAPTDGNSVNDYAYVILEVTGPENTTAFNNYILYNYTTLTAADITNDTNGIYTGKSAGDLGWKKVGSLLPIGQGITENQWWAINSRSVQETLRTEFNAEVVRAKAAESAINATIANEIANTANNLKNAIDALDYETVAISQANTITAISETNGIISVVQSPIKIDETQVENLRTRIVDTINNEVKVADTAVPVTVDRTLLAISINNGVLDYTSQEIHIAESQVNGLVSDLANNAKCMADFDEQLTLFKQDYDEHKAQVALNIANNALNIASNVAAINNLKTTKLERKVLDVLPDRDLAENVLYVIPAEAETDPDTGLIVPVEQVDGTKYEGYLLINGELTPLGRNTEVIENLIIKATNDAANDAANNAANISLNAESISELYSIAENQSNQLIDCARNIANNAQNISNNAQNISNNAQNISNNAVNIAELQTAVAQIALNIVNITMSEADYNEVLAALD